MTNEVTPREFDLAIGQLGRSIEDLAGLVRDGAEQSSREHVEVRAELREMRRQLDTQVPSAAEFSALKVYVYEMRDEARRRLDALERENDLRAGGSLARASLLRIIVSSSTVVGVVAGLVVTLGRLLVPAG